MNENSFTVYLVTTSRGQMNENSFTVYHVTTSRGQMNENSFTVYLVTTSPTTPLIYSAKFVLLFNFWAFIFSHSVEVTENQPVLGLGF